jgi:hypothetical protein
LRIPGVDDRDDGRRQRRQRAGQRSATPGPDCVVRAASGTGICCTGTPGVPTRIAVTSRYVTTTSTTDVVGARKVPRRLRPAPDVRSGPARRRKWRVVERTARLTGVDVQPHRPVLRAFASPGTGDGRIARDPDLRRTAGWSSSGTADHEPRKRGTTARPRRRRVRAMRTSSCCARRPHCFPTGGTQVAYGRWNGTFPLRAPEGVCAASPATPSISPSDTSRRRREHSGVSSR